MSQKLEKHLSLHGVKPEKKIDYKGLQIFLADSGVHFDLKDRGFTKEEKEKFSLGYYLTVWGVGVDGKPWFYEPLFFESLHNPNLSDKKYARLKTAEKEAIAFVDEGIKKGLFNAAA